MATSITLTTNKASTNYTLSTGARGPAGPAGEGAELTSYTAQVAALDDYPTTFPPTIGSGADQAVAGNDARLHSAATVSGDGISISGQQISLSIGTGAMQVAAGDHTHTGVYQPVGSYLVAADITLMVESDPDAIPVVIEDTAASITNVVSLTQAHYDEIVTPGESTLYIITA